jgi:hypothetical protein
VCDYNENVTVPTCRICGQMKPADFGGTFMLDMIVPTVIPSVFVTAPSEEHTHDMG